MEIKKKLLIILIMFTMIFVGCVNTKDTSQEKEDLSQQQEDTSQEQQLLLNGISLTKDIINSVYRGEEKYTYEALLYALAGNVDENNLYKGYFPFDEDKGFIFPLDKSNEVLIQVFGEKEYFFENVFDYEEESNIYYKDLDFGWNTPYIAENVTANISDDKLKLFTKFELINLWYNVGGDPVPTAIADCEITYCIDKSNDKIYLQFENIEIVSKIENKTVWEDKNFEALIRYYLGNFDKDIYFKDLNNITELEIKSNSSVKTNIKECYIPQEYYDKIDPITSMKDIDNFNNLKKIALWSNEIETIHIYKNSSNIEYLNLTANNITDITNITEYNNLTYFNISDNYIENLKPLGNLTKLKDLILDNIGPRADNIDGCIESNIDIDDIDDLKNLEHLRIWSSNLTNVSKLNNLNNLIHLTLYRCGVNGDELCFSSCNNLETLGLSVHSMSEEPIILDINKFDSLINLKSLYIANVFINKDENFSKLINLKDIDFTNVEFENIEILESLSNLENISFDYTNIENFKCIKNNKNLKSISVTYGNLSDISDLQLFTNIENLILPDNKITDISVLTQLNNLKKVVLANNPIIDYSVIEELKKREGILID